MTSHLQSTAWNSISTKRKSEKFTMTNISNRRMRLSWIQWWRFRTKNWSSTDQHQMLKVVFKARTTKQMKNKFCRNTAHKSPKKVVRRKMITALSRLPQIRAHLPACSADISWSFRARIYSQSPKKQTAKIICKLMATDALRHYSYLARPRCSCLWARRITWFSTRKMASMG